MLSQAKTKDSSEQLTSTMPRPLFNRNGTWDSVRDWPKSSILNQCTGPPFFFESGDASWLDTARKTLETSPWPGFLCFPLVSPVCPEISSSSGGTQPKPFSQAECDSKTWKISLNVSHFCPEEISVKTNEGYLEITGKHEEKPDDHGAISRSFTRKYKLPAEVDVQQMSATLFPEGVLSVEAPLGESPSTVRTETVIPVQIQQKQ